MLIIDKNKDYYDYLAKVYGADSKIVYDRRGSILLTNEILFDRDTYVGQSYWGYNGREKNNFVLEVGTIQYLFELSNYKKAPNFGYGIDKYYAQTIKLLHTFKENKHFFNKEISIVPVHIASSYSWKARKEIDKPFTFFKETVEKTYPDKAINNPILDNTKIPSFIPALDIWKEMNNYIGSTSNDKNVDIKLTDVDKAVNHGFDKKTSFRNPIKW